MFDWLGFRKGLPLWLSYRQNRHLKRDVEAVFEGIAETRVHLLQDWASDCWRHLDRLAKQIETISQGDEGGRGAQGAHAAHKGVTARLIESYERASDFTELFVLDAEGLVVYSTHDAHCGTRYGSASILASGLTYALGEEAHSPRPCLFGPYADPLTLTIGARSSSFHDRMTLLFIQPITGEGAWSGAICARVPNDVIGDLIQRESGHVYPDSGDNYIFMAEPVLQTSVTPGMALSRSRFEDRTFTHGENLKDGVKTDWGIVSVREHTELEILFTDPATGQLHPGVAHTIRNGSNLFVEFPGYSDYRHIPVIGKGVTFQLPHCPDKWGMMCEGDLEEVYRIRSLSLRLSRPLGAAMMVFAVLSAGLAGLFASMLSPVWTGVVQLVIGMLFSVMAVYLVQRAGERRAAEPLRALSRFIRINAEGKGDLTQRIDTSAFDQDEVRELAKWINNMIDSLEGIMLKVRIAAADVSGSQQLLLESTSATVGTTERVSGRIGDMIRSIRRQLRDIDVAKEVADGMRETLHILERQASEQIAVAQGEVERIGDKMAHISNRVSQTNTTIHVFMETAGEIRGVLEVIEEISAQTNLLALNASIEAARVGEHGRGFAVVASEIRKLADMTRQSTAEVHAIVEKIYNHGRDARSSMDEGTRVVEEGTALVAVASETLGAARTEDLRKTRAVDEVVALMEKVAAVSIENRTISAEVEGRVQELMGDIGHVRHTSQHVEGITAFLRQLVGQFRVTETRKR